MRRHNRYRFRLVSISCDPNFRFSIDGHRMTVIEADGMNVKPLLIDSLDIHAGACDSKPVISSIKQRPNRSTLLVGCKMPFLFLLVQGGVPHAFVGLCEPTNWQLLCVFCLLLVARINVNRDTCAARR